MRLGRALVTAIAGLLAAMLLLAVLVSAISPRSANHDAIPLVSSGSNAAQRQVYSPVIASDPYVRERWEQSVRALERACEQHNSYCKEAKAARVSLDRRR